MAKHLLRAWSEGVQKASVTKHAYALGRVDAGRRVPGIFGPAQASPLRSEASRVLRSRAKKSKNLSEKRRKNASKK